MCTTIRGTTVTDPRVRAFFAALFLIVLSPLTAIAQSSYWVQIEAHATLRTAEDFAARYETRFGGIAGFRIAGGWYGLAVGPFPTPEAAEQRRAQLLAAREIRDDAYVTDNTIYGQQFWPVGGQMSPSIPATPDTPTNEVPTLGAPLADAGNPAPAADAVADAAPGPDATMTADVDPAPAEPVAVAIEDLPDEPVAEARRLEAGLSREEKMEIQIALQWYGYYRSLIDADFGPGTRSAIRNWQSAQGVEATGFLTTRQRVALVTDYQAAVARFGFGPVRDDAAGIELTLPLAMVAFDRHEAPFAHFREINDSGMRVLLLSQEGTQNTLFGLYEILQTLEVIPLDGERDRSRDGFIIRGTSPTARAHVEARLRGGAIKGWALLWDPSADADAELVLSAMRDSFRAIDGVLPSTMGATASTVARRDLVAGLEVRRPVRSRTGFFVDAVGTVVTTSEAVDGCGRVTIDEAYRARVRSVDPELGIAVLSPEDPLVPLAFAQFSTQSLRQGASVRVSGFSYQDTLTRPILTFGEMADLHGLNGEDVLRRLTLQAEPGDSGGPVFDGNGAVIGMLLPRVAMTRRMLPEDVNFALSAEAILATLAAAGVTGTESRAATSMSAEILTRVSADLTVLVSCWN